MKSDFSESVRELGSGSSPLLHRQLCLGSRILSSNGHDDFNQGQISARRGSSDRFFIKSGLKGFDNVFPDDIIEYPVEGDFPVSMDTPPELPLHQAIYKARADVNAIVHSHSSYAIVFGATDLELQPISHEGAYFQGNVSRFTETSHTVLDSEIAGSVARALGDKGALFLRNHGLVTVGVTVKHAVLLAIMLERACKLQTVAESIRQPYSVSSAEDVCRKRAYIFSDVALRSYWEHAAQAASRDFNEAAQWMPRAVVNLV